MMWKYVLFCRQVDVKKRLANQGRKEKEDSGAE